MASVPCAEMQLFIRGTSVERIELLVTCS